MHKQAKQRWYEIQFYLFCNQITNEFNKDLRVVQKIIDGLELYGNYNADYVKKACVQILSDMRYKPSKKEIIILAHFSEDALAPIIKTIGSRNKTAYKYIHEYKENPIFIMPRLEKDTLTEVISFMETYKKLKGVLKV